jgi:hypothetical protein
MGWLDEFNGLVDAVAFLIGEAAELSRAGRMHIFSFV